MFFPPTFIVRKISKLLKSWKNTGSTHLFTLIYQLLKFYHVCFLLSIFHRTIWKWWQASWHFGVFRFMLNQVGWQECWDSNGLWESTLDLKVWMIKDTWLPGEVEDWELCSEGSLKVKDGKINRTWRKKQSRREAARLFKKIFEGIFLWVLKFKIKSMLCRLRGRNREERVEMRARYNVF